MQKFFGINIFILSFLLLCCVSVHAEESKPLIKDDYLIDTRCITTESSGLNIDNKIVYEYARFSNNVVDGVAQGGDCLLYQRAVYSDPNDMNSDLAPIYCVRVKESENVYDYIFISPYAFTGSETYYPACGLPATFALSHDEESNTDKTDYFNYANGAYIKQTLFKNHSWFKSLSASEYLQNYYVFHVKKMDVTNYEYYEDYSDYQFESYDDFLANCPTGEQMQEDFLKKSDYNNDRLPVLDFNVKQAFVTAPSGAGVKYTWTWSAGQHEIYANNPNKYKLQMIASANIEVKTSLGTSTVVSNELNFINDNCKTTISNNIPVYKESYSFLDRDIKDKLVKTLGENVRYDDYFVYYLFVRVIEPGTENCSVWKKYKMQGRIVTQEEIVYDEDGESYEINEEDKDKNEPDSNMSYDEDARTDASKDESSELYDDSESLDGKTLMNNLENVIAFLKGVPDLFNKVFLWMPDYIVTLISLGFGIIVLVAIIKWFT